MNRKILVVIEMRNIDADSPDPWQIETSVEYDPSSLTMDDAIDMRPKIDFAMRALRNTGDFLDAWIKSRMDEYLKAHMEREKR